MPRVKFNNSIFAEIIQRSCPKDVVLDVDLLTAMFCRSESEIKAEEEAKRQCPAVEVQAVLEQKRIAEIAVCISSLKTTAAETIDAILSLDEHILDEESLRKLKRICPSADELKLLSDNSHRIDLLSP